MPEFAKEKLIRLAALMTIYAIVVAASLYLAFEVRFDFVVPADQAQTRLNVIVFVVCLKLLALVATRQIRALVTFFAVPDLFQIVFGMTAASCVLLLIRFSNVPSISIPRGVILMDYMTSVAGICCFRLGARLFRERISREKAPNGHPSIRIAIIGAGGVGASLAKEFLSQPSRGFKPVAFFDDDPSKQNQLLHGIPVLGPPDRIGDYIKEYGLAEAVIAMPKAPAKKIRDIVSLATSSHLKVETIPSPEELASGRVKASRIRPVQIEDLLGREAVDLDEAGIRTSIQGKIVLVTGASGSIGSELCRQIAAFNPSLLVMLDQSEFGLFYLERELAERGYSSLITPIIADILDEKRIEFVFSKYRPQLVFHAAAYKHVHMMERQYTEAFRNNTIGTYSLGLCASKYGALAFVLISTDKAVNPTSVMGATKRLAEALVQCIQQRRGNVTKFMAVRFGNVLGSSGSVVPIFRQQIAAGGPITITHPDATRYFMTIAEAAGLVLQASTLGRGGDIFVLDMGKPVRIFDLAKQMLDLSGMRIGEDIEINYIGLKPGEKMFEELQLNSEEYTPTTHPRISRFKGRHEDVNCLENACVQMNAEVATISKSDFIERLVRMLPEYKASNE